MSMVLVLGAEEALVADALARAGADGGVVVLDRSADRLAQLERSVPDPRIWYLIGDTAVVPLPDGSMDEALGGFSPDVERVLR
jgi:ubiquinone/menaquinone biosynthesis C-methylase UbiE